MADRQWISRRGKLPPDKRERLRAGRAWVEENREEIDRMAEAKFAELETIAEAMRALKAAREARGLSLADVSKRSGIDKANLSKLENDPHPNPTWSTLTRIAAAIGVRLTVGVRDAA